jgi:hypothetical protein
LEEMLKQLKEFSTDWETHAGRALEIESRLFDAWAQALSKEVIG